MKFFSFFFLDKKETTISRPQGVKSQDSFSLGKFHSQTCDLSGDFLAHSELPERCPQFVSKILPLENRSMKTDKNL